MRTTKLILLILIISAVMISCAGQKKEKPAVSENPFFTEWTTPFGAPPFDRIKIGHFKPAIQEGIKRHQEEIKAIADNPEPPTFSNTLETLDRSGLLLDQVEKVLENLLSANTSDELQALAQEMAPTISAHYDEIYLNPRLFARIKAVYDQRETLSLTPEQKQLLEKFYKDFVRAGANLDDQSKARLKEINQELAVLELKFAENVLKETNAFELVIDNAADLEGLSQNVVAAAAEAARERGKEGKWVFTLHKPSLIPFLQYSPRRELREKIFKAYINRGNNSNAYDNKALVARTIALRIEKARLLGYKTWADYVLEESMAKTPANVYRFLDQVWQAALKRAREEAAELQKLIEAEGGNFKLEP